MANFLGEKVDILSKGPIVDLESIRVKILEILESGSTQISSHCRDQMRKRNFSMRDIDKVLKTGEVKPGKGEGDDAKGVFRIYGHDIEGDPLGVTVEINEKLNQLIFITGFGY